MYNLIKLNIDKNINISYKINEFKSPKNIYIPILSNSTFKLNEYIYKNTSFTDYSSSISGNIIDSKIIKLNNKELSSVVIKNDYKENIKKKTKIKKPTNREELINVLREYHLNNIADKIDKQTIISNIVISSIDEEPYSVKELITLSNNYEEVLDTIDYLANLFSVSKCILANKSTNFNSIKNVNSVLGTYPNIDLVLVPDKYLISYKPFLGSYLNLSDAETLTLTTTDILEIYTSVINNSIVEDTIITISGNAIKKGMVIKTKLYVSLSELLDEYIKIIDNDYEIYLNGYISGWKIDIIDGIIITRDIHTIVINKREYKEEYSCINCGACMKVCPVKINVKRCYFNKINNKTCISCGLCDYVCPSNLKLRDRVEGNNEEKGN